MNPRLGLWVRITAFLALFGAALGSPIIAATDYGPSLFTGSASYVVPIQTLPGKGVAPSLALQYDSGGGKSAYGWGWSLLGGGEISRVGKGFHRIPRYDSTDEFQLSMRAVSSDLKQKSLITGNHPGDDNFYVTENEMFFRIRKDVASNGWIVTDPDGTTYEFLRPIFRVGSTAGFDNARAWALSRVISHDGYSMDFTYDIDTSGGDYYLNRIEYTKLISGVSVILDTKRSVVFTWVSRGPNNTIASYVTGSKVEMDLRLGSIDVYADRQNSSSLYRRYVFTYNDQSVSPGASNWITPESKLIKVESYGIPTGIPPSPPLFGRWTFEYTGRDAGWAASTGETLPYPMMQEKTTDGAGIVYSADLGVRWAEMNGNPFSELIQGKQDLHCPPPPHCSGDCECTATVSSTRSSRLDQGPPVAGGANTWTPTGAPVPPVDFVQWQLDATGVPVDDLGMFMVDIDGDGDTDMLKLYPPPDAREVWIYDAGSWQRSTAWESQLPTWAIDSWSCCQVAYNFTKFAELNGDSCPDMLIQKFYNSDPYPITYVAYNPCTAGQPWEVTQTGLASSPPPNWMWGTFTDLNGDGLSDLIVNSERYIPTVQSSYSGVSSTTYINTGSSWLNTPGNPLDTTLIAAGASRDVYYYDSSHVQHKMDGDLQFADVNGDGFTDVLTNSKVLINHQNSGFISVCSGTSCPPLALTSGYPAAGSNPPTQGNPPANRYSGRTGTDVIDLKGNNGLPGYVRALKRLNGSTDYAVHPANGQAPGLLSRVVLPSGASLEFTYDMSWKYPNSRIPHVQAVVKSMTLDDGAGGRYATNYIYSDGWFDAGKRCSNNAAQVCAVNTDCGAGTCQASQQFQQQFRGFGVVEATGPNQVRTRTTFLQKDPLMGVVSREETFGSDGFEYSDEQHFYTTNEQVPPDCSSNPTNLDCAIPYFNPETSTLRTDCEAASGATCLTEKGSRTYSFVDGGTLHNDPNDRVASIETRHRGEMVGATNVTPDALQRTERVEFRSNLTDWIVELPARRLVFRVDDSIHPVLTTSYFYDQGTGAFQDGQSWDVTPLSGRVVRTLMEGTDPTTPATTPIIALDTRAGYDLTYKHVLWTDDPLRNRTYLQYNADPDPTADHQANIYPTIVLPPAVGGLTLSTTTNYDMFGRVQSVKDANDFATEIQYDAFDRTIRTSRTKSGTILGSSKSEYLGFCDTTCATVVDPKNRRIRTSVRQFSGQQDETQWPWSERYLDGLGRDWLAKTITLDGQGPGVVTISKEQIFNAAGRPWKTSPPYTITRPDPNGMLWTELTYDPLGRPLEHRSPLTLPAGTVTVRTRQEQRIVTDGTQHRFETTAFDTEDRAKRYWDDVFGNRYRVTEYPSFGVTHWVQHSYDVLGHLTDTVDDAGTVLMHRHYDGLGRLRTQNDPDSGSRTYDYDPAGRLFSTTDAKSNRVELHYDAMSRMTQRLHFPATGPTYQDQYEFDRLGGAAQGASLGQLVRRSDSAGTFSESYVYGDSAGRVSRRTTTILGDTAAFDFTYNDAGAVVDLTYDSLLTSEAVHHEYSPATGQLLRMWSPLALGTSAYVDQITYDPLERMRSFRFGNGVVSSFAYNDSGDQRLSGIGAAKAGANLLSLGYERNLRGLLSRVTDTVSSAEARYEYDDLGRLHVGDEYSTSGGSATLTQHRVFEYDVSGRMLSLSGPYQPFLKAYDGGPAINPPPAQTLTFQYGSDPSCTIASPLHAPCGDSTFQYEYDANGALTFKKRRGTPLQATYTFNDRHRLSHGLDEQGVATDLYYDTEGNLIARTRNGQTDHYFGFLETTGTSRQRQYFLENTRIATRTGTNPVRYLHADDLGSVRAVSDENGTVTLRRDYYEFGAIERSSGADTDRARAYAGLRWDPAGEGYDAGARLYPANRPMFLSPDALSASPNSPQSYNRYAYARNDPINYADPSGYSPQSRRIIGDQVEQNGGGGHVAGKGSPGSAGLYGYQPDEATRAFDELRDQYNNFMWESTGRMIYAPHDYDPGLTVGQMLSAKAAQQAAAKEAAREPVPIVTTKEFYDANQVAEAKLGSGTGGNDSFAADGYIPVYGSNEIRLPDGTMVCTGQPLDYGWVGDPVTGFWVDPPGPTITALDPYPNYSGGPIITAAPPTIEEPWWCAPYSGFNELTFSGEGDFCDTGFGYHPHDDLEEPPSAFPGIYTPAVPHPAD